MMGVMRVEVNGHGYEVGCEEGEEERVKRLAGKLEGNVRRVLRERERGIGDAHALVMAGIMLADEEASALLRVKELEGRVGELEGALERAEGLLRGSMEAGARATETAARRLGRMVERLERAGV